MMEEPPRTNRICSESIPVPSAVLKPPAVRSSLSWIAKAVHCASFVDRRQTGSDPHERKVATWTESSANTAPFHRIAGSRVSHEASGTVAGRRQIDSLQGTGLRSWAVASDIGCSRQLLRGVTI